MQIYTIQMSAWREAKRLEITFIDSTVKSGDKRLAPTWDMVINSKNGNMTAAEYEIKYRELMAKSQADHPKFWDELCAMPKIALACYCNRFVFCHRHILAEIIKEYALTKKIVIKICGEIAYGVTKRKKNLP
jgi:uncharacterized protein YeaO (DUF488 family)